MHALSLGDRVKDEFTGYEGTVTGIATYLNAGNRIQVSRADKDGNPQEQWFDEGRLTLVTT